MSMTPIFDAPIFDALCREHPTVGLSYQGAADESGKYDAPRLDWAGLGSGSARPARAARHGGSSGRSA